MKPLFYSILFFFICTITYAQEEKEYGFDKGDFYISTAINYSDEYSDNSYFLRPAAGYFLTSNISLGIQTEFLINQNTDYIKKNSFRAGINGRYSFMPKKRFNVFTELAFDYKKVNIKDKSLGDTISIKDTQLSSTIATGANFFITKNLSLFMKIDLLKFTSTDTTDDFLGRIDTINVKESDLISGIKDLSFGISYKF